MTKMSNQNAKRILVGLTPLFFVLGCSLLVEAGLTNIRNLFSFLVASYLILWGGYALISRAPKDENQIRVVLMTISVGVALFLAEVPIKLIDYRKTFFDRYLPVGTAWVSS